MSALKTNGTRARSAPGTAPTLAYEKPSYEEPWYQGAGWVLFATVMFVIAACLSVVWGIAAVSGSHFFVANAHYIISDLNTWGWIMIGFGAVEALAAPFWSLALVAMYLLVIYGLAAYGGRPELTR